MNDMFPDGEDLRRAVKWVSEKRMENPETPANRFVQEAIFRFDLSPRDADFLIDFFSKK